MGGWYGWSPYLHHLQSPDSLLPIAVALDRWTPFYWGQDRFGMPIAFFAGVLGRTPRQVFFTYHIILGILLASGIILLPYLFRVQYAPSIKIFLLGAIINLTAIAILFDPFLMFETMFQPPGASMGLTALGLLCAESALLTRSVVRVLLMACNAVCVFLAIWIDPSSTLLGFGLLCSILLRRTLFKGFRIEIVKIFAGESIIIAGAFLSVMLWAKSFSGKPDIVTTHLDFLGFHGVGTAFKKCFQNWNIWSQKAHGISMGGLMLIIAAITIAVGRIGDSTRPKTGTRSFPFILLVALIAMIYLVTFLDLKHVRDNLFSQRYFLPWVLVSLSGCSMGLANRWRHLPFRHWAVITLLSLGLANHYDKLSIPTPTNVMSTLRSRFSPMADELFNRRCHIVSGDYIPAWEFGMGSRILYNSDLQIASFRSTANTQKLQRLVRTTQSICVVGNGSHIPYAPLLKIREADWHLDETFATSKGSLYVWNEIKTSQETSR